jgi:hypothetical protein
MSYTKGRGSRCNIEPNISKINWNCEFVFAKRVIFVELPLFGFTFAVSIFAFGMSASDTFEVEAHFVDQKSTNGSNEIYQSTVKLKGRERCFE